MSDAPQSVIAVVLFTDLVDSTRWKGIGDREYTTHVRRPHDTLFRQLLAEFPGAVERDNAGDGFLATFPTPSDAVRFAVRFHRELAAFDWAAPVRVTGRVPATRAGIHLGEVVEYDDPTGRKVSGQAVDLAARVMSVAAGGRTLLTRHAADSARQHIRDEPLGWAAHGQYRFKGKEDDPLEIFEVGPEGVPLPLPPDGEKARRVVIDPADDTGAWRPAVGLAIPGRDGWVLESQLGEGGFGEVWLAKNKRMKEVRVFKFCFDADRLRSFKRELTFFKLIQSELGHRSDFATLHEVRVEKPPYTLESEYVPGGNLGQWIEKRGGVADWPLADRLRFLAGVGRAVAAAHSLGIIHKDIKPSNVLVRGEGDTPQPVLADFGIGVLTDRTALAKGNVTETGFTESVMLGNDSSRTGTRLYSPPETLAGKTATTGADVYALGVMLFQLTAGDLHQPLGIGWGEAIRTGDPDRDALLMEDITAATFGDPARRLATAAEFADRLERLDARVTERKAALVQADWKRKLRTARRLATAAVVVMVALGGLAAVAWVQRNEAEAARTAETVARQAEKERADGEAKAKAAERTAKEAAMLDRDKQEKAYAKTAEVLDAMVSEIAGRSLATQKVVTPEQRNFLANVLDYYREFAASKADDRNGRERIGLAANQVGMIEYRLGNPEAGVAALKQSVKAYEALASDFPAVSEYRHDLAGAYGNLGLLLTEVGRVAFAVESYRKSQEILKKLVADFPQIHRYRLSFATAFNNMGKSFRLCGRWAEAEKQYRAGVEAILPLPKNEHEHSENRYILSVLYIGLGDTLSNRKDWSAAEDSYRKGVEIMVPLVAKHSDLPDYRHCLASTQNNIGLMLSEQGKWREAGDKYREALETAAPLVASSPTVHEYRKLLATVHYHLGDALTEIGQVRLAETHYGSATDIIDQLVREVPAAPAFLHMLVAVRSRTAFIHRQAGRRDTAELLYRQTVEGTAFLVEKNPAIPEYRRDLATGYLNYGDMLLECGKYDLALRQFKKAIEIVVNEVDDAQSQHRLLVIYCKLGETAQNTENFETAIRWYEKSLAIAEKDTNIMAFANEAKIIKRMVANCKAALLQPPKRELAPLPRLVK